MQSLLHSLKITFFIFYKKSFSLSFLLLFDLETKSVMSILSLTLMLLLCHFDMCMLMYNVD